MTAANKLRLCACLLNISEARNASIVERVASSALKINAECSPDTGSNGPHPIKSAVLNIFRDYDYNRSVITIVSAAEHIGMSVFDACKTAYELIDLRSHSGGHPRLGSVDLVPIHPICEYVPLDECGTIARDIATNIAQQIPGTSAFLFGAADLPQRRGLVARRKAVKWYQGSEHGSYSGIKADVGPDPSSRYGLTGIGAIPYVMNCNVTIDTQDVEFGHKIAHSIRATTPGGLLGVQSMAFAHDSRVEIACNVEAVYSPSPEDLKGYNMKELICNFGNYYHVRSEVLEKRVADMTKEKGITTVGTALIGYTPQTANKLAKFALKTGRAQYWKDSKERRM